MKLIYFTTLLLMLVTPLFAMESKIIGSLNVGRNFYAGAEYKKAIKIFEQLLRDDPETTEAHQWLGMAYLKLGDNEFMTDSEILEKAVAEFRIALRHKPDLADAHFYLGITHLAQNNKSAALSEYEALKSLDIQMASSLHTRIQAWSSPSKYRSLNENKSYVTKVTILGNQVFVPVTFANGDVVAQAVLLLDTGATVTSISPGIAGQLNIDLTRTKKTIGQVVGGGLLEVRRVKLAYIMVGPYTKTDLDVAIIEHKGPPIRYDGLLGMNFLRGLKYSINFDEQTINWTP